MSFKPYTEKIKKKIGIRSILGRIRIQNRKRIRIKIKRIRNTANLTQYNMLTFSLVEHLEGFDKPVVDALPHSHSCLPLVVHIPQVERHGAKLFRNLKCKDW